MGNETRGIRNNNPGNIRHGDKWDGLASIQDDGSFCTFTSPQYGIRAMTKILINYQKRYGIETIRGIIDRWAPPVENDTESYINHVADSVGVSPDEQVHIHQVAYRLVTAIIKHENGYNPYSDLTIVDGIHMAFK